MLQNVEFRMKTVAYVLLCQFQLHIGTSENDSIVYITRPLFTIYGSRFIFL